jgi:NAD(P)H dehydrogenase (quinone)
MFAITGATGQLGRKVVTSLLREAPTSDIVAVARDAGKAANLGVDVRAADYREPQALERAFAGIYKLLLISSSSFDTRQAEHANVIAAAKAAGVRHVVYTSLLHADRWAPAFARDHVVTEERLKDSGLAYTILRNGWYWENHTAALGASLAHGMMVGSAGEARISWASRQDFADAASAVLTGGGHAGNTYELAGDTSYTMTDLAAEAMRQSGKPLIYRNLPEQEHAGVYASFGLPPPVAAMLAEVEARGVSTGVLHDDGRVLSTLTGRPTLPLEQAVAEALHGAS